MKKILVVYVYLFSSYTYSAEFCRHSDNFITSSSLQYVNHTQFECIYKFKQLDSEVDATVYCPQDSDLVHAGYDVDGSSSILVTKKTVTETPTGQFAHSITFTRSEEDITEFPVRINALCGGLHVGNAEEPKNLLECVITGKGHFRKQYGWRAARFKH